MLITLFMIVVYYFIVSLVWALLDWFFYGETDPKLSDDLIAIAFAVLIYLYTTT